MVLNWLSEASTSQLGPTRTGVGTLAASLALLVVLVCQGAQLHAAQGAESRARRRRRMTFYGGAAAVLQRCCGGAAAVRGMATSQHLHCSNAYIDDDYCCYLMVTGTAILETTPRTYPSATAERAWRAHRGRAGRCPRRWSWLGAPWLHDSRPQCLPYLPPGLRGV